MDSFDQLPLSCIINNKFIALHGGLSPELDNVPPLTPPNLFSIRLKTLNELTASESLPALAYSVTSCGVIHWSRILYRMKRGVRMKSEVVRITLGRMLPINSFKRIN